MCQHQAMASDLSLFDIFAPTKNSYFEVSDDVITCDLWFGPPQSKILAMPMNSITKIIFPSYLLSGSIYQFNFQRTISLILSSTVHCCSKFFLLCIDVFTVLLAVREVYCGL